MTESATRTSSLLALRRGFAFACIVALSLMSVLLFSTEPALAQADDGDADGSPAVLTQGAVDAVNADTEAADEIPNTTASVASDDNASVSEGSADSATAEEAEEPTDKYQACIVVGENQQREYDGTAIRDDEYYVEVTYEGNDEAVRYYARDKDDVSGFVFLTEAGELLDQPPVNAGVYKVQAQILATSRHLGRALEDTFEITKKVVPVPTVPAGFAYTGEEQRAIVETDLYSVEGGSATEVGEYTARLTLKDPNNYTFAGDGFENSRHLGFLDIAWAINDMAGSQEVQRRDYQWEVSPVADPDLTFGSMTTNRASSPLVAKIMTVRDNCIDRLSAVLLNFVKFARLLFPDVNV